MESKPNILFLFSDQHNARILGHAGHPDVLTPRLDALAAEGTHFSRAYCQDGVCAPSRVSMFTGQYPRTTGVIYNPDQPTRPNDLVPLQSHLKRHGYATAAIGKRHLKKSLEGDWDLTCTTLPHDHEPSDEYYWDWIRDEGHFEAFERDWNAEFGFRLEGNQSATMGSHISDLDPEHTMEAYTARKTIAFLRAQKDQDRPFFCWSSFYRPHQPYTPPRHWAEMYDFDALEMPGSLFEPVGNLPPMLQHMRRNRNKPWCLGLAAEDPGLYRKFIGCYYALVTEIDHWVGQILDELDRLGLAENTIVIYSADHGDFVGAHGMIEKIHNGHNVYEDTLRVPLIIRTPEANQITGNRQDLVELVDLYPSLLDLAGVPAPQDYNLPGRSLAPVLRDGTALGREVVFSENYIQLTAITATEKLGAWIETQGEGFPDMFFDRTQDPDETRNMHGQPEAASRVEMLQEHMRAYVDRTPNVTDKPLTPLALG
jgi:arylsulfatase A-like enzyme